jgi:hypothetical protein
VTALEVNRVDRTGLVLAGAARRMVIVDGELAAELLERAERVSATSTPEIDSAESLTGDGRSNFQH